MEIVKVSGGLPNKFPWEEGKDYEVIDGEPEIGDVLRLRDKTGEQFLVKQPPAPDPEPAPEPEQPTLSDIKAKLAEITALVNAL